VLFSHLKQVAKLFLLHEPLLNDGAIEELGQEIESLFLCGTGRVSYENGQLTVPFNYWENLTSNEK
jgi:hypothetical protein